MGCPEKVLVQGCFSCLNSFQVVTRVIDTKRGVHWPLWQLSTQAEVLALLTQVERSSVTQLFTALEELAP